MHAVVDDLPTGYQAVDVEGVVIVVGPTGAFALCGDDPDAATAARRVAAAAVRVRNTLAARLSWAPFVDPLVVVDRVTSRVAEATVVPRRMLRDLLTAGNPQLGEAEIGRIVATLDTEAA
jgi:hypothetical protein